MSMETGIPEPFDINGLPCGPSDRADGVTVNMGTAALPGQVIASAAGGVLDNPANMGLEEEPDSPVWENAEQQTITHRFNGGANVVFGLLDTLHRGMIRTDSNGFWYKLLSATGQWKDADHAILTTVEEAWGGDTPPDDFDCVPMDLGLHILKHPRYFDAFVGNPDNPLTLLPGDVFGGYGSDTELYNQMVIRLLQNYFENTTAQYRDALHNMLAASIGTVAGAGPVQPPNSGAYATWEADGVMVQGTDMAKSAALEIITKYWRGEETPPLFGFQVIWTEFSWFPMPLNPGGYIEDPTDIVPSFLINTWDELGETGKTMFDDMGQFNPQCYSRTGALGGDTLISWRREPDQPSRNRTFWCVQHKWVGSPVGFWDSDLFNHGARPSAPEDYRQVG